MPKSWHERVSQLGREIPFRTGYSLDELRNIPIHYRQQRIKKRSGGSRVLSIPYPELKDVQRALVRKVFARLSPHYAAMGFVRGRSIVDHARLHVGKRLVVRLDIHDYFPTTKIERVRQCFKRFEWPEDTIDVLTRICCHPVTGGLPQGAPTSPVLSNIVNFILDVRLKAIATSYEANYSRYADDLTFSFDFDRASRRPHSQFVLVIERILSDYGYRLNANKTAVMRGGMRQVVTGLVVNEKVALPRHLRRAIRAAEHRNSRGQAMVNVVGRGAGDEMSIEQLRGWQAFRNMIDESRDADVADGAD